MPEKAERFGATLTQWKDEKGFGYLDHDGGRLFLHIKDFSEHHKRPEPGDQITYELGTDQKGRPCAVNAIHVNDGGKVTTRTLGTLGLLTLIPLIAGWKLSNTYQNIALYGCGLVFVINIITYLTYKGDKQKAKNKTWRTSESTLHWLEMSGGWPAAYLAQRKFRHKCSKAGYQLVFGIIVATHLYVATDFLVDWKITRTTVDLIKPLMEQPIREQPLAAPGSERSQ
ncbi:DUF1294 domain-containing protein [Sulfuriroseicoccus oceanibius]|uniref:Cold shock and DUF1294 domain-containing protein n=1 Tax=Sulfuriroseicoccus oceanibius TaxID=2707525 RepID=A0A7T7F2U1_9BACT|nr:DUF1294 domain-containing protein [Sulfuriroseicoccus oceanibius]QQL45734.1 cold shock and DUF1294 domain-containing protein [Sulfuriroseicoccus oceanibius]